MKRIGLFLNEQGAVYHGIYRANDLVDYADDPETASLIAKMFKDSHDGLHMEYAPDAARILTELCRRLSESGWVGECIYFSDEPEVPDYLPACFLGFDICGEGMHYSPLGDGFLEEFDRSSAFWKDESLRRFRQYADALNANGLFDLEEMAAAFASLCREKDKQYPHAVETEGKWKTVFVYRVDADFTGEAGIAIPQLSVKNLF